MQGGTSQLLQDASADVLAIEERPRIVLSAVPLPIVASNLGATELEQLVWQYVIERVGIRALIESVHPVSPAVNLLELVEAFTADYHAMTAELARLRGAA